MASGTGYAPFTESDLIRQRTRMPQITSYVPDSDAMKRRHHRGRYTTPWPGPHVDALHVPLSRMFRDSMH